MSLTTGRGPFGTSRGVTNITLPDEVVYAEAYPRRVRGFVGGDAVIDSQRVVLVHRTGRRPGYAFPTADVRTVASEPEPAVDGYVHVRWSAVDEWYEEDELLVGHPRNPYHRIDILRSSRQLRVEVAGVTIVDTADTLVLYETSLDPKLYVDRSTVTNCELVASDKTTYCPYKGTTTYWNAVVDAAVIPDVAWSYDDPYPESTPIAGLLSFEPGPAVIHHDLPAPAF
jgi:uncharacterized protein (DUF427 family)